MSKKHLIDSFLGEAPSSSLIPQSKEFSSKKENKSYTHNSIFSDPDQVKKNMDIDENQGRSHDNVLFVSTNKIKNWKYHDRLEVSYGDIDALAEEFSQIGQQQPCIVRRSHKSPETYELIIGERRWRAAQKANMDLMVIVKDINDKNAALSQAAENENRSDLTDYEKGISYTNLIEDGVISQKDLIEKLGKTKQYVSAILSFGKIPKDVVNAIGDMSKISAVSAERIKQIANKSPKHKDALIKAAPEFNGKSPGITKINNSIANILQETKKTEDLSVKTKVTGDDGRHLFTWRKDNNDLPSIHFPKDIAKEIASLKIDQGQLNKIIATYITKSLSPSGRTREEA